MNMRKIYFASYDVLGTITGLYNTEDHRNENIPVPNLRLSDTEYLALVRRPSDFSVNVTTGTLQDSKVSKRAVDKGSLELDDKVSERATRIAAGFIHKKTCYYADDEASAHATQCLLLATAGLKTVFRLKAVTAKGVEYVEVNKGELLEIVEGINSLRTGL